MNTDGQNDWVRTVCVAAVVIASMFLLAHVIDKGVEILPRPKDKIDVAPLLALLGAITTFLGSAIGLFFGIRAGQAGIAQTAGAATVATQAAQAATATAATAQKAAEAAVGTTQGALVQLEATRHQLSATRTRQNLLQNQLQSLRQGHTRAMNQVSQLKSLLPQAEHAKIDSILATAAASTDVTFKLTAANGITNCIVTINPGGPVINYPSQPQDTLPLGPGTYGIDWIMEGAPGGTISIEITDAAGKPLRAPITDSLGPGEYSKANNNQFTVS